MNRLHPCSLILLAGLMLASPSPAVEPAFPGLLIDGSANPLVECTEGPETLCLLEGRLQIQGRWKNQHDGGTEGAAQALPMTDKTGMFWFFQDDNIEVIVKALDGTTVNRHFWIFLGSLSDVEYWIDATDTTTGETVTYYNPPGNLYGIADTTALGSGEGQRCGTLAGLSCPRDLFCDLRSHDPQVPVCQITDAEGVCTVVPDACPEIFDPVCGCDGVTYANDCHRIQAQIPKEKDGECG